MISRACLTLIAVNFIAMALWPCGALSITLKDAVEMALTRSEQAGMISDKAEAGRASARAALSEFKPQMGIEAGYFELGTNADPNPLFPQPDRDYNATLTAAQLIWAGGRVSKGYRLKGARESLAGKSERIGLSELRYKVAVMYHGALFMRARLGVLTDRAAQRQEEMEDARATGEAGLAAPLDVRYAAVSLNMAREAMLEGDLEYRQALIDFNLELGNVALREEDILEPDGEPGPALEIMSELEGLESLLDKGSLPELEAARLGMRAAELEYGMERGRWLPELSLIGSATTSGEEASAMDESWMAGVNLSFDIYDGGLRGALRSGALARREEAARMSELARKLLKGRVLSMRMRAVALARRIELWEDSVRMASENYEDARAEYRAGLSTLTRLGEFNLAMAESRLGLLGLYLEQQRLLAEIGLLRGLTR